MHDDIVAKGYDPRWFICKDIVKFCEWLRAKCNDSSVSINTWKWGGRYTDSGLRTCDMTQYSEYSQHRYKDSVDIKVDGFSVSQLRKIVVDNFEYINKMFGITTIERIGKTPTWLHVDRRWTGLDYLKEF